MANTDVRELGISIHASAKEATNTSRYHHLPIYNFNPRLREGGDVDNWEPKTNTKLISIHASAKEATF